MDDIGYRALSHGAHALKSGKVHLWAVDAIPVKSGWRYMSENNHFFAAGPVRDEILEALAQTGPNKDVYRLSLRHAIVLYPDHISLTDLEDMLAQPATLHVACYHLTAELPFGSTRKRVRIVIDSTQEAPLS